MDKRTGVLFLFILTFNIVFASSPINSGGINSKKGENAKKNLREEPSSQSSDEYEDSDDKYGSYEDGSDENDDHYVFEDDSSNSDGDNKESNDDYNKIKSDEDDNNATRSIRVGDTFTAQELLPITKTLLKKVDNRGGGNGIVSSAKSPEALADKLFEALFVSRRRIVVLEEVDLSALDALQALSLNGEAVDLRTAVGNSFTERPSSKQNFIGSDEEVMSSKREPGRCHYKVITKKVEKNQKSNIKRGIVVANKLSKKQRLNVRGDRGSKKGNSIHESVAKRKTKKRISRNRVNKTHSKVGRNKKHKKKGRLLRPQTKHPYKSTPPIRHNCQWKYKCLDGRNLDTCRLHMICPHKDSRHPVHTTDDIFIEHNEDEHRASMKQFRKMLGITILDEEIEKIIQSHLLRKRPDRFSGNEKIQTLEEYFNGILIAEQAGTTTAVTPEASTDGSSSSKEINGEKDLVESDKDHTSEERRRRFPPTTPMMPST